MDFFRADVFTLLPPGFASVPGGGVGREAVAARGRRSAPPSRAGSAQHLPPVRACNPLPGRALPGPRRRTVLAGSSSSMSSVTVACLTRPSLRVIARTKRSTTPRPTTACCRARWSLVSTAPQDTEQRHLVLVVPWPMHRRAVEDRSRYGCRRTCPIEGRVVYIGDKRSPHGPRYPSLCRCAIRRSGAFPKNPRRSLPFQDGSPQFSGRCKHADGHRRLVRLRR